MNRHPTTVQSWALFVPEIKALLQQKDYSTLKNVLKEIHPVDLAEGWFNFSNEEKVIIFKLLATRRAVEVFEELNFQDQYFLLNQLEEKSASEVLVELDSNDKARLFRALPERIKKKLFSLMAKEDIEVVHKVMQYPKDTAGSLMHTDYITISPEMTAKQALTKIQTTARIRHTENLHTFYVVDKEGRLLGGVSLRRLIVSPQDIKIHEIMTKVDWIKIDPHTKSEEVANLFSKYDLFIAPVVDENNHLIGVILDDDITDLLQKLNTKQFYEIGKMDPAGGVEIRYSQVTALELVRRRAGWLVLLLIFDFLTGTVLKTFEHALSSVIALSFFIPMILDTGGNAGAQTSVSIIRGLAIGDVTFANAFRVAKLELLASFLMALIVGTVAFIRAILLQGDIFVSLVVGGSMFLVIILAIFTGIFLPLFSKRIGLDPAVLAGPITTSVVDVVGLIIYFKIAELVLPVLRTIH